MKKELIRRLVQEFESAVHITEDVEFWFARDLQVLLGYAKWENFLQVLERAIIACRNSGQDYGDHFADVRKMVEIGSGTQREIPDVMLTRYACYLIAQNGDPRKDQIAFAMSYFAVQTRKQEILERRISAWERLRAREKLTLSEKELSGLIYERGVDHQGFARIRSKGDRALFGGHTTEAMKSRLGIPVNRALADFLPTITIKAKDFATEITNFNVRKEDLHGEDPIAKEHVKNNDAVRRILCQRGIRPENLPAEEDIKKLKRRVITEDRKLLKCTKKLKLKRKRG